MTTGSCHFCDAETTERFGGMWLCAECEPGGDENGDESSASASGEAADETEARGARLDTYTNASFASDALDRDEWPAAHRDVDAWMCRKDGKAPWAPWTDDDAPVECTHGDHDEPTRCDRCRHSAKFKWGSDGPREHVHTDYHPPREPRHQHPPAPSALPPPRRPADPLVFRAGAAARAPEPQ